MQRIAKRDSFSSFNTFLENLLPIVNFFFNPF